VYCGRTRRTTRDHIPPEALFAPPGPPNPITVPACSDCHGSATSRDDEYFRTSLAFSREVFNHPDIQGGVLIAALRSLAKPEAAKFSRAFFRTVFSGPVHTPAGIYLGDATGYTVDGVRISRVVERIVRGLFYHERHVPLGGRASVRVFHDDFIAWDRVGSDIRELIANTVAVLRQRTQASVGSAFRYAHVCTEQDERASAWLLTFYDAQVFLAITAPDGG
jgi:hypothetical protein